MLTCNGDFVDLTGWTLRRWTCIKLIVLLQPSLEKEREPGDRVRPSWSHPHSDTPAQSGLDQTGLDWTVHVRAVWNLKELNWTESQLCFSKEETETALFFAKPEVCVNRRECGVQDGRSAWRYGWCLKGVNCCMCSFRRNVCVTKLLLTKVGAFTLPAQSHFYSLCLCSELGCRWRDRTSVHLVMEHTCSKMEHRPRWHWKTWTLSSDQL